MAWNQPTGAAQPPRKAPSKLRGLVAFLILVALAGGAAWYLFMPKAEKTAERKDSGSKLIKDVGKDIKPAPQPKPTMAEMLRARYPELSKKIPDDWDKPYPPQAYRKDGTLKRYSRYVHVVTNVRSRAMMSVEELTFSNPAEVQIAEYLTIQPGETLVGDYTFGRDFEKKFLESLKEVIVIDKEKDTSYQQDLKRLVIEAKKELKERYDAGEDIVEIMNETRKQYKELALYRDEIADMVQKTRKEHGEMTAQDKKDLVDAANLMLKDRGCVPLRMPRVFVESAQ